MIERLKNIFWFINSVVLIFLVAFMVMTLAGLVNYVIFQVDRIEYCHSECEPSQPIDMTSWGCICLDGSMITFERDE